MGLREWISSSNKALIITFKFLFSENPRNKAQIAAFSTLSSKRFRNCTGIEKFANLISKFCLENQIIIYSKASKFLYTKRCQSIWNLETFPPLQIWENFMHFAPDYILDMNRGEIEPKLKHSVLGKV